jgi:hypothetical protein
MAILIDYSWNSNAPGIFIIIYQTAVVYVSAIYYCSIFVAMINIFDIPEDKLFRPSA